MVPPLATLDPAERLAQRAPDHRQLDPDVHQHRAHGHPRHRVVARGEEELKAYHWAVFSRPVLSWNSIDATSTRIDSSLELRTGPPRIGRSNSFGHTDHSLTTSSGIAAMPVATCRPWVNRYSQTGRVGHQNHGWGC